MASHSRSSMEPLLSEFRDADTTSAEPATSDDISVSSSDVDHKAIATILKGNQTAPKARKHEPPPYVQSLSRDERAMAETALVRKIDLRLIPPLIIMYILNYLDRNNIASARLAGLEEDLGLRGTQYQTCVSILFLGYLLMQIPSNLFLNKTGKPSLYLPICMVVWGLISTATAGVQSFAGLLAVRFFLGFVEAPYFPGCLFFLSAWYTRKELAFRTAMLYSGSLISGAFSGLIAAGITSNLDGTMGLSAWRWLFIIEGTITIFLALCAVFVLPDFPRTTPWLTDDEKALAIWRLDEDIGEDDWVSSEKQTFSHGFVLACRDIKMWILMIMLWAVTFAGSVTNFFPTIVQTLGYDRITSLLLTTPPYLLCMLTAFANARHADRTGERYLHVTLPLYVAIAAFLLAATTTSTIPRYISMLLMVPGIYTGYVVALGWISNTIPRPPAKRAAALAAINAVSNTSSIVASYLFDRRLAPRYVLAMVVCGVMAVLAVFCATVLRRVLVELNERLERGECVEGAVGGGGGGEDVPEEAARRGFRFLV